jgi:hypothetical protein
VTCLLILCVHAARARPRRTEPESLGYACFGKLVRWDAREADRIGGARSCDRVVMSGFARK